MRTIRGSLMERVNRSGLILATALVVATVPTALVTAEGVLPSAAVETRAVPKLGVFPEGEITGIGSMTLDIAGRMYSLHPKLTIVSDEGLPMEMKQLRVGLVVQYHVQEGAVDRLIVLLPR